MHLADAFIQYTHSKLFSVGLNSLNFLMPAGQTQGGVPAVAVPYFLLPSSLITGAVPPSGVEGAAKSGLSFRVPTVLSPTRFVMAGGAFGVAEKENGTEHHGYKSPGFMLSPQVHRKPSPQTAQVSDDEDRSCFCRFIFLKCFQLFDSVPSRLLNVKCLGLSSITLSDSINTKGSRSVVQLFLSDTRITYIPTSGTQERLRYKEAGHRTHRSQLNSQLHVSSFKLLWCCQRKIWHYMVKTGLNNCIISEDFMFTDSLKYQIITGIKTLTLRVHWCMYMSWSCYAPSSGIIFISPI